VSKIVKHHLYTICLKCPPSASTNISDIDELKRRIENEWADLNQLFTEHATSTACIRAGGRYFEHIVQRRCLTTFQPIMTSRVCSYSMIHQKCTGRANKNLTPESTLIFRLRFGKVIAKIEHDVCETQCIECSYENLHETEKIMYSKSTFTYVSHFSGDVLGIMKSVREEGFGRPLQRRSFSGVPALFDFIYHHHLTALKMLTILSHWVSLSNKNSILSFICHPF